MVRKKAGGRLFFFISLALFFLIGGPALAAEDGDELCTPVAVLNEKSYVYNGRVQYITLDALSHPLAEEGHFSFAWYKDGELLSCAASALPIRNVSDSGTYYCKVTFTYGGRNAETVTNSVEIRVEKKEVEIPEIPTMVYTGYRQYPQVYENAQYRISKNDGALEAGRYFVVFSLKDPENHVFSYISDAEISEDGTHLSVPYTVERAENEFSTPLSMSACYEGMPLMPQAYAKFGEVRYRYFSDAAGVREIDPPSEIGTYYVQAVVDENPSVTSLASSLLSFEVLPLTVSALRMISPPSRLSYTAFETLSLEGLSLVATMVDGSVREVPPDAPQIIYPVGGRYLLAKDTHVLLSYGGAVLPLAVTVSRASLDFTGIVWSTGGWTYDGEERVITLSGLPPEVSVSAYRGNRITCAGTYTVSADLHYDRENYEGPASLETVLKVERVCIPVPSLPSLTYSGMLLVPRLSEGEALYSFGNLPHVMHAGTYSIPLRLTDPQNYCFDGTEMVEIHVPLIVHPIALSVEIENVSLRIGERFALPAYKIVSGALLADDTLGFGAKEERTGVKYYFENTDYAVTYTGGAVERIYRLPPATESVAFFVIVVLLLVTLSVLAWILLRRRRRSPVPGSTRCIAAPACTYPLFTKPNVPTLAPTERQYRLIEKNLPESEPTQEEETPDEETASSDALGENLSMDAVDVSTADALITDALAEALVTAEDRVIYTDGSRHGVINVDTLSAAFAPGETVDINRLKKKRLIAQDVGYLKVLARGSIDKPLTVCADDFSLGAIKMIALTGGRTFHVKSRPLP